jgi:sulfite exporter TauE/SafE
MLEVSLVSILLLSIAALLHCSTMCGCLSTLLINNSRFKSPSQKTAAFFVYQAGKLTTYTLLGLIFGFIGQAATHFLHQLHWLGLMPWFAAIVTILVGLSVTNVWRGFQALEAKTTRLFQALLPGYKKLFPVTSYTSAYTIGLMWGLLPCGLVYSALFLAAATANPLYSALLMAVFGLLTIPGLAGATLLGSFVQRYLESSNNSAAIRITIGSLIVIAGVSILFLPIHHMSH